MVGSNSYAGLALPLQLLAGWSKKSAPPLVKTIVVSTFELDVIRSSLFQESCEQTNLSRKRPKTKNQTNESNNTAKLFPEFCKWRVHRSVLRLSMFSRKSLASPTLFSSPKRLSVTHSGASEEETRNGNTVFSSITEEIDKDKVHCSDCCSLVSASGKSSNIGNLRFESERKQTTNREHHFDWVRYASYGKKSKIVRLSWIFLFFFPSRFSRSLIPSRIVF